MVLSKFLFCKQLQCDIFLIFLLPRPPPLKTLKKKTPQLRNMVIRSCIPLVTRCFDMFFVSSLIITHSGIKSMHIYTIPSMYGIFTYIWPVFLVNVGKYTVPYMDAMEVLQRLDWQEQ